jgi:beta-galactosidase
MEQQPGPVNWAPWNPVPKRGMVRLWTWEALAHGAEVVSYFRWRQAPFAQEQMHAGLLLPGLHELSQGGIEATQAGGEIAKLGALPDAQSADVAIVYDYETSWITRIQPQGADFTYHELAFRWYEALRRLGLDIDFVGPGMPLDGYKLVIVPSLAHVSDDALRVLSQAKGHVLFGPRTGSKTRHFSIPPELPPGPLAAMTGVRVREVSSLRPNVSEAVRGKVSGRAVRWREHVECAGDVLAKFENGDPAFMAKGQYRYLACWPDAALLSNVIQHMTRLAKLKTVRLPEHIRLRRRGNMQFAFNYGNKAWAAPVKGKTVLGDARIAPQSIAAWRA